MELKQVMGNRRSIRYFEPDKPVEREKIQVMLEAMNRSSRAVNADFVKGVVAYRDELDPEVVEQLKTPTTTADIDLAPVHIFFYLDLNYVDGARQRLKELVDVGALNPSHGWSHAYVDEVVWATVLKPMSADPGHRLLRRGHRRRRGDLPGHAGRRRRGPRGLPARLQHRGGQEGTSAFPTPGCPCTCSSSATRPRTRSPAANGPGGRSPPSSTSDRARSAGRRSPRSPSGLKSEGLIQERVDADKRRKEVKELAERFGLAQ